MAFQTESYLMLEYRIPAHLGTKGPKRGLGHSPCLPGNSVFEMEGFRTMGSLASSRAGSFLPVGSNSMGSAL